jgi:hypothetical protein
LAARKFHLNYLLPVAAYSTAAVGVGRRGVERSKKGIFFSLPTHMWAQIYKGLVLQTLCTEPPESFKNYKGSSKKVLKAQIVGNLLELLLLASAYIRVPNLIWRNHCDPISEKYISKLRIHFFQETHTGIPW